MSYAQGFEQLRVASENYNWNLNYGDMAKIWREGCIIRAQFLQKITDAYEKNPELKNLMLDDYFKKIVEEYQNDVRDIAALAIKAGVACQDFLVLSHIMINIDLHIFLQILFKHNVITLGHILMNVLIVKVFTITNGIMKNN